MSGAQKKGFPFGLLIKGALALLISVVAFWWALHDADFDVVAERLSNSSPAILLLFVVSQLLNHVLRTWRWALLIAPLGQASPRAIFAASSLGYPATFFLPLRLGEFVRPVMISRSGVPFAGGMASVVVERVTDGLFNLGLFFVLFSAMPADAPIPDALRNYSLMALALFGGGLIVLILITLMRRPAFAVIKAILTPFAPGLASRVLGLLGAFIDGLGVLRTPGRIGLFFILTAAFWLINGFATWMLAATYVPELPLWAGPFVVGVMVFAVMIPAGPAFAGTLEAGVKFGLAPYGIAAGPAGAVALALHALQLVVMALLAGIGFLAAEPGQTRRLNPQDDLDKDLEAIGEGHSKAQGIELDPQPAPANAAPARSFEPLPWESGESVAASQVPALGDPPTPAESATDSARTDGAGPAVPAKPTKAPADSTPVTSPPGPAQGDAA